jgi:hypothetical protein
VARSAAARSLRRLDLELPVSDVGIDIFVAEAGRLRAIGELVIPGAGVPSAKRALLERALPNLTWGQEPEEEEEAFEAIDPFPAVSPSF